MKVERQLRRRSTISIPGLKRRFADDSYGSCKDLSSLKNCFRDKQRHRPCEPACCRHPVDQGSNSKDFKEHCQDAEGHEGKRHNIASDHPLQMLCRQAKADRNRREAGCDEPHACHGGKTESEYPTEIGMKSQIEGRSAADADRGDVTDPQNAMQNCGATA